MMIHTYDGRLLQLVVSDDDKSILPQKNQLYQLQNLNDESMLVQECTEVVQLLKQSSIALP